MANPTDPAGYKPVTNDNESLQTDKMKGPDKGRLRGHLLSRLKFKAGSNDVNEKTSSVAQTKIKPSAPSKTFINKAMFSKSKKKSKDGSDSPQVTLPTAKEIKSASETAKSENLEDLLTNGQYDYKQCEIFCDNILEIGQRLDLEKKINLEVKPKNLIITNHGLELKVSPPTNESQGLKISGQQAGEPVNIPAHRRAAYSIGMMLLAITTKNKINPTCFIINNTRVDYEYRIKTLCENLGSLVDSRGVMPTIIRGLISPNEEEQISLADARRMFNSNPSGVSDFVGYMTDFAKNNQSLDKLLTETSPYGERFKKY